MLSLFNTGYGLQDQLDGVKNGIAIVSTGNTHIAITSGQYVYIQDHGTLAEGLYKATSNISANGTLSSSNVTAAGNALNTLNSNLTTVSDNVQKLQGVNVSNNTNIDTLIATGDYYIASNASAATMTNLPVAHAGTISVKIENYAGVLSGNWQNGKQIFYDGSTADLYMRRIYTDGSGNFGADSWVQYALNSKITKVETVNLGSITCASNAYSAVQVTGVGIEQVVLPFIDGYSQGYIPAIQLTTIKTGNAWYIGYRNPTTADATFTLKCRVLTPGNIIS